MEGSDRLVSKVGGRVAHDGLLESWKAIHHTFGVKACRRPSIRRGLYA